SEPAAHLLTFLHPKRHLAQVRVQFDRQIKRLANELGGNAGARQRRGDNRGYAAIAQLLRGSARLGNAGGVQRNINIALRNALRVPVGLAVAEEPEWDLIKRELPERPVHLRPRLPVAAPAALPAVPSCGSGAPRSSAAASCSCAWRPTTRR